MREKLRVPFASNVQEFLQGTRLISHLGEIHCLELRIKDKIQITRI